MEHSRFGNIRSKRWPCPTPGRSARWQSSNWLDRKPTASICITRLTIFCLGDFWWSAFQQGPLGCCDDQMTFSDQHGSLQSALCPCQLEICETFATASWKACPKPLPIPKNSWFKLGSASYNDGLRILQLGMYSKLRVASCCIRRDTGQGTISQQPQEPFDKGISHVFWEWCHLRTWQDLAVFRCLSICFASVFSAWKLCNLMVYSQCGSAKFQHKEARHSDEKHWKLMAQSPGQNDKWSNEVQMIRPGKSSFPPLATPWVGPRTWTPSAKMPNCSNNWESLIQHRSNIEQVQNCNILKGMPHAWLFLQSIIREIGKRKELDECILDIHNNIRNNDLLLIETLLRSEEGVLLLAVVNNFNWNWSCDVLHSQ